MSLDQLHECTECKKHAALRLWIQVHASFDQARMSGSGPDFLSAMIPGPGMLKVEVCISCRSFRPLLEYTPEEEVAMVKYKEHNESKARTAENLGKFFGLGK